MISVVRSKSDLQILSELRNFFLKKENPIRFSPESLEIFLLIVNVFGLQLIIAINHDIMHNQKWLIVT